MSINGKCATAAASWVGTPLTRPFKPVLQNLLQHGSRVDVLLSVRG